MGKVGQREVETQREVVRFFREALGYDYLGDWRDREGNAHIELDLLGDWLRGRGVDDKLVSRRDRPDRAAP